MYLNFLSEYELSYQRLKESLLIFHILNILYLVYSGMNAVVFMMLSRKIRAFHVELFQKYVRREAPTRGDEI